MNIDTLREEFDKFLTSHNFDMTNDEVIAKAVEIENMMFTYVNKG